MFITICLNLVLLIGIQGPQYCSAFVFTRGSVQKLNEAHNPNGIELSCQAELLHGSYISGPTLKQLRDQRPDDCCIRCSQINECAAVFWNDYQNGTCWFKSSAEGKLIQKPGVKSYVFKNKFGKTQSQKWKVLKNFDMTSMESVRSDWTVIQRPPGFTNHELQTYVDSPTVLYTCDNATIIRAIKQGTGFISARLHSKHLFNPMNTTSKMLRYEFTGTVPTAKGAWPAYWMIGTTSKYGGYPVEGEIDVLEWVYAIRGNVSTALHWNSSTDGSWGSMFNISDSQIWHQYYTYGVEVSGVPNREYVQFYLRDPTGATRKGPLAGPGLWANTYPPCPASQRRPGASRCSPLAPFDNDMYLIMNIAVGGAWGSEGVDGDYSALTEPGVEMKVKRVTVYEGD